MISLFRYIFRILLFDLANRGKLMKSLYILCIAAVLALTTGCGIYRITDSDMPDVSPSDPCVYPATRADLYYCYAAFGYPAPQFIPAIPFLIADLPIALLVDTVYFPRDVTDTEDKKFHREEKKREKKYHNQD